MTNPFDVLNNAAPAPAAAPFEQPVQQQVAPQGFAPAPQAAPQAYAPAPQQFAPQQAPVAPAAPAQPYTPINASADALNPAQAGVSAFGTSSSGEKHSLRTDMGKPILVRIHGTKMMPGRPGESEYEVVECDWIVLDPSAPVVRENALISNRRVVVDLKNTLNSNKKFHVGRVTEVPSKHPVPAISLAPLTDEEKNFAVQAGNAVNWF